MTYGLDETHDPELRSWVDGADDPQTDFPIQNLPFCRFRRQGLDRSRIGVGIGGYVLDLAGLRHKHLLKDLPGDVQYACVGDTMFNLELLGPRAWSALRRRISALLSESGMADVVAPLLIPQDEVELLLPGRIGDYTDFYASIHHATNVGRLFRPDAPLLPNYRHLPIGYHGRSSSLVASGTPIVRPRGQRRSADAEAPSFGPSRALDYELEVGFFIGGAANRLGEPVPLADAEHRVFGLCLVNDWSARDIQAWEYQPLGPFLGKSFATTVSPWIVSVAALAPFRCPAVERAPDDVRPLPYLRHEEGELPGFEITVSAWLETDEMRQNGHPPFRLGEASFADMYWTVAQMLTHHASNGCPLRAGDLMASGTVSGPEPGSLGSLLEITKRGSEPVDLPGGEQRGMLEDGDEVILEAYCERDGYRRIGFGECRGRVVPVADA